MAKRIFILEQVDEDRIDLRSCHKIGEVIPIFEHWKDRPDIAETKQLSEAILDRLETNKYDPDEDYICFAGSQALNAVLLAVVGAVYAPFDALLWLSGQRAYLPYRLGDYTGVEATTATEGAKDVS